MLKIIFDKGFQRDMQTLEVICKLCQWLGPLRNYQVFVNIFDYYGLWFFVWNQDHLEQSHKQYKCEHCNEIFNALPSLEDHTNNSCSKLLMNCVLQLYGCKHQVCCVRHIIFYLVVFYVVSSWWSRKSLQIRRSSTSCDALF